MYVKLLGRALAPFFDPPTLYRLINHLSLPRAGGWRIFLDSTSLSAPPGADNASLPLGDNSYNLEWRAHRNPRKNERLGNVLVVDNGIALSNGIVLDGRGKTLERASHRYYPLADAKWKKHARKIRKNGPLGKLSESQRLQLEYHNGAVVALGNSNPANYFHTLFEDIGRMALLSNRQRRESKIFVQQNIGFQKRLMELMDVSADRILSADQPMPFGIQAEKLVVPCFQTANFPLDTEVLQFLRGELIPAIDNSIPYPKRIFVSRARAGRRIVSNEASLLPILEREGFDVVCLEDLSVDEQILLFRNARVIVSPHGASLANLVFCEPGTRVLELFSGVNTPLYFLLSRSLGLKYYYLSGKDRSSQSFKRKTDIEVDVELFERKLKELMEDEPHD